MKPQAIKALQDLLGREGFSRSKADTQAVSSDAALKGPRPAAVARPRRTEEVARIIGLANRFGFPVYPRGAGTGKAGASLASEQGLVLDLSRMDRILELNPRDMLARVEPGVITVHLQAAAEAEGLYYPPDPASRETSTLGGNLATCAGGVRAVKYGVTRDYVLGLTAVMGSGEVIRTGTRTIKGVVGYDLTRLLVGSEGTLGVITRATLKLIPRPPARSTLVGVFPDLEAAALAVNSLLRAGSWPAALEFLDQTVLQAVKKELPFELAPQEGALILVELDGSEEAVREESRQAARFLTDQGGRVIRAGNDQEAQALWAARRSVSETLKELKPHKVSEDVAVPRSRLAEAVRKLEELGRETGLLVAAYGHAGDGNIHVNILYESGEESKVDKAVAKVFRIALDLGGTLSGEHGVGLTKAAFLDWELGQQEIGLMKGLKALFDPQGILNPGKIFPPAK